MITLFQFLTLDNWSAISHQATPTTLLDFTATAAAAAAAAATRFLIISCFFPAYFLPLFLLIACMFSLWGPAVTPALRAK